MRVAQTRAEEARAIAAYWRERVRPCMRIEPGNSPYTWDMLTGGIYLGSIQWRSGLWMVCHGAGRVISAERWAAPYKKASPHKKVSPILHATVEAILAAQKSIAHFYKQQRAIAAQETYFIDLAIELAATGARKSLTPPEFEAEVLSVLADKPQGATANMIASLLARRGVALAALKPTLSRLCLSYRLYRLEHEQLGEMFLTSSNFARALEQERFAGVAA